jgi:membrane protein
VSKSNAIYGSFAALPLFLIWLQISWHIVLMGAEVTHYHQNFESNEREEHLPDLSFRAVKKLGLRVFGHISRHYLSGESPQPLGRMGEELHIPSRVLADITRRLAVAGILSEVSVKENEEPGFLPARDPHHTSPYDVLHALEKTGEELAIEEGEGDDRFSSLLEDFDRSIRENPGNRPFGESTEPKETRRGHG